MLGTSTSLTSLTGWANPTDPPSVGSLGMHLVQVPQFSVMPYPNRKVRRFLVDDEKEDDRPCITVQEKTTRRKSWTWGFNGADPDVRRETFPPRAARTYLICVRQGCAVVGKGVKLPC